MTEKKVKLPVAVSTVLAVILLMSASESGAGTITFETMAVGTAEPFSIVVDGITASFSSPGAFHIATNPNTGVPGTGLSNNVLLDADPAIQPLAITFNSALSSIALNFAVNSQGPAAFTLAAFIGGFGGTQVGLVGAPASPTARFPEGTISFSGSFFDAVRLSSTAQDFAVDNIAIAAVPEPSSLLLFGTGAAAMVVAVRRRRKQQIQ